MKHFPAPPAAALLITIAMTLMVVSGGCGSADSDSDGAGAGESPTTSPGTRVVPRITVVATPVGDAPVAATPGVTGDPPATASTPPPPRLTPSFRTKVEFAPIDDTEMIIRESFPPQYALRVVSGLPSGCHQFDAATVDRDGTEISVTVTNLAPDDAGIACTAVYGQHEQTVELGSDFVSSTVYTVTVNGDPASALVFTAQ